MTRAAMVSCVTLGNAFCGLIGCAALMRLDSSPTDAIGFAAGCIFAGFALDRVDGTLARRLNVDSPFGAQLDSLCDVLTFGLLPALLILSLAWHAYSLITLPIHLVVAMAYLTAAIVRLARFTVAATNVPGAKPMPRLVIDGERHYHGLPSPAAAMVVASLVLMQVFGHGVLLLPVQYFWPSLTSFAGFDGLTLIVSVIAALAMVKPWPYADPPRAFITGHWPRILLLPLVIIGFVAGPFTALSVLAIGYLPTGPFNARRLADRQRRNRG